MILSPTHPPSLRRAFSLVELLVVIGIITILIAILLPAAVRARESSITLQCLSNLRQLATAAQLYSDVQNGAYPLASYSATEGSQAFGYNWDFTTILNLSTGQRTVQPGLLWFGRADARIQQCPAFDGKSNTLLDPYTGYNYNTSYIGGEQIAATGVIVPPAKVGHVLHSSRVALFGDGQYSAGADKFMRSPIPNSASAADKLVTGRAAGTQGFRHRNKTNVAFCDGHAESLATSFTAGFSVAPNTGFLSSDNASYDTSQ